MMLVTTAVLVTGIPHEQRARDQVQRAAARATAERTAPHEREGVSRMDLDECAIARPAGAAIVDDFDGSPPQDSEQRHASLITRKPAPSREPGAVQTRSVASEGQGAGLSATSPLFAMSSSTIFSALVESSTSMSDSTSDTASASRLSPNRIFPAA